MLALYVLLKLGRDFPDAKSSKFLMIPVYLYIYIIDMRVWEEVTLHLLGFARVDGE